MKFGAIAFFVFAIISSVGCTFTPGKPALESDVGRPDKVLDFPTLYSENCASCHGAGGKNGAALSLANPTYLALAGTSNLERVISAGVPGSLMPPFNKSAGGSLTQKQIDALVSGMLSSWGNSASLAGQSLPPYASTLTGDPARGEKSFLVYCGQCHGPDGKGMAGLRPAQPGSLVDPAYLALISDRGLRSTIIAGQPEEGMPNWHSDLTGAGARAMTDQEITDIVAWLASQRVLTPGQPYPQHP